MADRSLPGARLQGRPEGGPASPAPPPAADWRIDPGRLRVLPPEWRPDVPSHPTVPVGSQPLWWVPPRAETALSALSNGRGALGTRAPPRRAKRADPAPDGDSVEVD